LIPSILLDTTHKGLNLRAVEWVEDHLRLLDQTKIPHSVTFLEITKIDQLVDAIVSLAVRGAPALGATGAYGIVTAIDQGIKENWTDAELEKQILRIRDARPTAVNLAWGADKARKELKNGRDAVLALAHQIAKEDEAANRATCKLGADGLIEKVSQKPLRLLTHCNTGMLATTAWGTAFGVIRELHERGLVEKVYADETRPLLQGSRLTAWELVQNKIPHLVLADGAAASTILRGEVDAALIGADRIAANGDTANKIGSLGVALACQAAGIPFMVVAPQSTVDLTTESGEEIEIELRDESEILNFNGVRVAPLESRGYNPAFDVTPAKYISAIVTELGVIEVSKGETPANRKQGN
jgi:methylthioribose-1-phosphate isomerase